MIKSLAKGSFFVLLNGQYETLLSTCIKQFTPPIENQ